MKVLICADLFFVSCGKRRAESFVGAQHAAPLLAQTFDASCSSLLLLLQISHRFRQDSRYPLNSRLAALLFLSAATQTTAFPRKGNRDKCKAACRKVLQEPDTDYP
jgi:hypothetical protein